MRKLLKAFALPDNKLTSLLREDIRQDKAKEKGEFNGGGDFHGPFWADAKNFILNGTDLKELTQIRVNANPRRKRLYPALLNGFMSWWNNNRRFGKNIFSVGLIMFRRSDEGILLNLFVSTGVLLTLTTLFFSSNQNNF